MRRNGEYAGIDERFIPENERYVDESILGNREESRRKLGEVWIFFQRHKIKC